MSGYLASPRRNAPSATAVAVGGLGSLELSVLPAQQRAVMPSWSSVAN